MLAGVFLPVDMSLLGTGLTPDQILPDFTSLTSGQIVVDLVRGRKGNPAAITADFCGVLRSYGIRRVYGDRYSGEWSRTEFRRLGLAYLDAPGTRSELYLSLSSALNAGRVELPPCQMLERQLKPCYNSLK